MLGKKVIFPVIILSLLFNYLFSESYIATAVSNDSFNARNTDVVQLQQQLNTKGFWIGAVDGILNSRAYQAIVRFQMDTNLVADGLVGLQTRQVPRVALIDQSLDSAPVTADNSPASDPVGTSNSDNNYAIATTEQAPVKVADKSVATVSRGASASSRTGKVITMVSTGYDGCYECNKPYYGYPSYIGLPLAHGIVAVDPNVIPMGTRLYVEGYGNAIAADQGNAIKGNRIDLFFDSHQEALKWGMKTVKVTILSN